MGPRVGLSQTMLTVHLSTRSSSASQPFTMSTWSTKSTTSSSADRRRPANDRARADGWPRSGHRLPRHCHLSGRPRARRTSRCRGVRRGERRPTSSASPDSQRRRSRRMALRGPDSPRPRWLRHLTLTHGRRSVGNVDARGLARRRYGAELRLVEPLGTVRLGAVLARHADSLRHPRSTRRRITASAASGLGQRSIETTVWLPS